MTTPRKLMQPIVQNVVHCNVNCRDLDRSVAFYRDLGFTPTTQTAPDPQDGSGFGIDGPAQWDAWMMSGSQAPPVIDLLEWKTPAPDGAPHAAPDALGMIALRITTPTVDTPTEVTDPDGTRLRLEPAEGTDLVGVVINVADIESSTAWYAEMLGIEAIEEDSHTALLRIPGDQFEIRFEQGSTEHPAYPAANHLGIYRIAMLVDDAAAAVEALRHNGADCPDAVFLDMGPTIPIDGLWAAFFPDPDGTCLEFIESPAPRSD